MGGIQSISVQLSCTINNQICKRRLMRLTSEEKSRMFLFFCDGICFRTVCFGLLRALSFLHLLAVPKDSFSSEGIFSSMRKELQCGSSTPMVACWNLSGMVQRVGVTQVRVMRDFHPLFDTTLILS